MAFACSELRLKCKRSIRGFGEDPILRLGQRASKGAGWRHRDGDLLWRASRVLDSGGGRRATFPEPQKRAEQTFADPRRSARRISAIRNLRFLTEPWPGTYL